jgi:hypothetical protein
MLVKVTHIETREETHEMQLPAFFKEDRSIDPYYIAVMDENTVVRVDQAFMMIFTAPTLVRQEIAVATSKYLPITEDEFQSLYNQTKERIRGLLFPINQK